MTAQSSSSLASYDPSICSSSSHGSSMKFHVVLVSSLLILGSLAYDSSGFKGSKENQSGERNSESIVQKLI
ncbi:hypothetical protein CDAR_580431 [Caerostris darwini]|uniref:Transmembrane protein n=1 Tax=Caerostris darwini TaxID=1538125 RepID=A0AAV4RDW5_9ARAC|nr:hypothetical protein CDAR_580431 [Caerostris darwini]